MKTKSRMKIFTLILIFAGIIFSGGMTHAITTTDWTEYVSNPVYAPGKAYYPTILKDGGVYTMWSDNAAGVQMATSTDGIHWTTVGQL